MSFVLLYIIFFKDTKCIWFDSLILSLEYDTIMLRLKAAMGVSLHNCY